MRLVVQGPELADELAARRTADGIAVAPRARVERAEQPGQTERGVSGDDGTRAERDGLDPAELGDDLDGAEQRIVPPGDEHVLTGRVHDPEHQAIETEEAGELEAPEVAVVRPDRRRAPPGARP